MIAFEDDHLLVLNKPAGLPSVPHSENETETAVGIALKHYPKLVEVDGMKPLEPGLLHRLDTGTSGLLAFAKSNAEFARLRALWKSGQVVKTYRAVVSGNLSLSLPQELRLVLAHHPKSAKRMIVLHPERKISYRGKPLQTVTRLVGLHGARDLEIEIKTGVMHQIRCTLAHLGYPLVGDSIYHGDESERLMLHAWKLSIPCDGKTLAIEAPLPW